MYRVDLICRNTPGWLFFVLHVWKLRPDPHTHKKKVKWIPFPFLFFFWWSCVRLHYYSIWCAICGSWMFIVHLCFKYNYMPFLLFPCRVTLELYCYYNAIDLVLIFLIWFQLKPSLFTTRSVLMYCRSCTPTFDCPLIL